MLVLVLIQRKAANQHSIIIISSERIETREIDCEREFFLNVKWVFYVLGFEEETFEKRFLSDDQKNAYLKKTGRFLKTGQKQAGI